MRKFDFSRVDLGLVLLFLNLISFSHAAAPDPQKILKNADQIRNPGEQYQMSIRVKTPDAENLFDVYLSGGDKTVIVTKEPARDRGRNMLMLDRDFYSYVPSLKRSVRLSLAQKLSGQVANGDIARTRWFGDYTATLESSTDKEFVLLLNGNKNNLTYQKIRLWVEKGTSHPLHADYLSIDGSKVVKRASFGEYKTIAGQLRPSKIKIENLQNETSTIEVLSMKSLSLDPSFFTEENMERTR